MAQSIDRNTVVVNVPSRITAAKFAQVLTDAGSPATSEATACYQAVVGEGVDPAFALAVFQHESAFGTDSKSIVVKFGTKNPGNTRSSTIGPMPLVSTDREIFVKFDKWATGFQDLAHRLVAKDYVYAQEGRKTIAAIIERWAPKGDQNNDPDVYINKVVAAMNGWIGSSEVSTMNDPTTTVQLLSSKAGRGRLDERTGITYSPAFITVHIQEGENFLPSFFATIDADSTMWVEEDGQIVRMLNDSDEAWTNGRWTEPVNHANPVIEKAYQTLAPKGLNSNIVALTVENQGFAGKQLTDKQYTALASLCAYWCTKNNWPADRQHIVGHFEVGEHKGCPGKAVSLERLVAMTQAIMAGAGAAPVDNTDAYADPNVWHCLVTDKWVVNEYGFLKRWRDMGGLAVIGYPITGARVQKGSIPDPANPNTGIVEQYFERSRFEYHRKDGSFHLGLIGNEALEANIADGKTDPA